MRREKKTQITVSIIAGLFLILAIINIILAAFLNPPATDDCFWRETKQNGKTNILIEKVVPGGVTDKAGIKDGDLLVKVNEKEFKSAGEVQQIINKVPPGQSAQYTIRRGNEIIHFPVYIQKSTSFQPIIMSIVGFFFLFVGYMVVINNPISKISRIFFFFSFVFFLFFFFQLTPNYTGIFPTAFKLIGIATMVLWGPAMLHFFLVFPKKPSFLEKHNWLIYFLYIPQLILVLLAFLQIISGHYINITTGLYFGLSCFSFFTSCSKIKDPIKRKALRVIQWGLMIGLIPLGLLVFFTQYVVGVIGLTGAYVTMGMMALLPISFGYAVMKYGLMDVSIVIKKSIIYSIITAIFISLYMIIVVGAGGFMAQKLGFKNQFFNFFFIAFTAVAFNPIKNRIQRFVDIKFYRKRYDYQKILLSLSQELPTVIQLDKILEKVSSALKNAMQVEKIVISVFEKEHKIFRVYNQTGIPEPCDCDFGENTEGISGLLDRRRCCIPFYKIDDDPELKKISKEDLNRIQNNGIVLIIPMFYRGKLMGLILMGPKISGGIFSDEDMDLLMTVAGQTAVAIENARLHLKDLRQQRAREELELARRIQQDLLPKKAPSVEGLEISGISLPASEVGGDYFDYIVKENENILVFVGDVSGKGMPAALYMSKVQGMIQMAGAIFHSPKDILMEVNQKIFEGIEKKSYITMLAALFIPEMKQVKICRAGHNPLFIKKADTDQIKVIQTEGTGLGLINGTQFNRKIEEITIPVQSNDYLILYSDGLTEAINRDLELFGEDRVKDIILNGSYSNPDELSDQLISAIKTFRQDAEQNDDITLVIVKIK